jgi:alcohol dehydrogenase
MQPLTFEYRNPPQRIVFGRGALGRVAEELAAISARTPMLVCSARGAQSAAGRSLIEALNLLPDAVFDGVEPHAPVKSVNEAWKRACAIQPDCFVALGGGSAADTTKGIALAYAEEGRVLDFVLERTPDGRVIGRQSSRPKLPILAIPTTLSGAEVSPSFALTDDTAKKLIIRDNAVAPSILVYDPDLVRAMPLHTLAPSAMNAIAHTVEALYSKGRNPISAMYASEGLQLLHEGLSAAIADAADADAYVSLTLGAYYAAAAIVNARTALHHAICHKLAPAAGLSHGTANSIILPHALRFNLPAARPELTRVARLICNEGEKGDELRAEDGIAKLGDLCARAGLPRRLRDVGVKQEIFPALAEKIFGEPGLAFNPRELRSVEEIEGVLHAAW